MCLNPGRVGHGDIPSSVQEGEQAEIICLSKQAEQWRDYLIKCYGPKVLDHVLVSGVEGGGYPELPMFRRTKSGKIYRGIVTVYGEISAFCRERGLMFVDLSVF